MDIRDVLPSICLREYLTERKKKKKKKKISVLDILLNYYFVLYERISLPSIEMEDFSVWVSKAPFRKRRRRRRRRVRAVETCTKLRIWCIHNTDYSSV